MNNLRFEHIETTIFKNHFARYVCVRLIAVRT